MIRGRGRHAPALRTQPTSGDRRVAGAGLTGRVCKESTRPVPACNKVCKVVRMWSAFLFCPAHEFSTENSRECKTRMRGSSTSSSLFVEKSHVRSQNRNVWSQHQQLCDLLFFPRTVRIDRTSKISPDVEKCIAFKKKRNL